MTSSSTDSWLSPQPREHPLMHGWRRGARSCSDHRGSLSNLVSIYIDTRGTQKCHRNVPGASTACSKDEEVHLPTWPSRATSIDGRKLKLENPLQQQPKFAWTDRDYSNSELRFSHWTLPSCKQRQHRRVSTTYVRQVFLDLHPPSATASRTALHACSLFTW